jgi:hypothetical protein
MRRRRNLAFMKYQDNFIKEHHHSKDNTLEKNDFPNRNFPAKPILRELQKNQMRMQKNKC